MTGRARAARPVRHHHIPLRVPCRVWLPEERAAIDRRLATGGVTRSDPADDDDGRRRPVTEASAPVRGDGR